MNHIDVDDCGNVVKLVCRVRAELQKIDFKRRQQVFGRAVLTPGFDAVQGLLVLVGGMPVQVGQAGGKKRAMFA